MINFPYRRFLALLVASVLLISSCSFAAAFLQGTGTCLPFLSKEHSSTRHFYRQRLHLSPSTISSAPSSTSRRNVIFQKTVRPEKGLPPALFIANLVEYLQDRFQIPSDLPMIYESSSSNGQYGSDGIVTWDSPLTTSSVDTRMLVEVIGICTDETQQSTVPDMAMVVVSKDKDASSTSSLAPMMKNLFADSEKRILKALDRGLDDFSNGKIKFTTAEVVKGPPKINNVRSVKEAIEAEIVEDASSLSNGGSTGDEPFIVEPEAIDVSSHPPEEDFAVRAARQAAIARKTEPTSMQDPSLNGEDYAIQAAKRVAASRSKADATAKKPVDNIKPSKQSRSKSKPLRMTISTPKDRAKRITRSKSKPTPPIQEKSGPVSTKSGDATKRGVNMRVVEANNVEQTEKEEVREVKSSSEGSVAPLSLDSMVSASSVKDPETDPKIVEDASGILDDIARQGSEMTPEELLQDVLKFGEKQDDDNTPGRGFVRGAFEKAKDILREQQQARTERLSRSLDIKDKVSGVSNIKPDILDPDESSKSKLSAEEELKRIFEAGERLAEGRLDLFASGGQSAPVLSEKEQKEQEDLEALIRGEKTVSSYSRSLDEELAELEVRINRSPAEDTDGQAPNPVFDILSGPEVYNRNVDPETAVNWPGAPAGTKTIRLPRELDAAVKQAQFASEVLVKMRTVEDANGTPTQYFIGKRKLSQQQVANLQAVVNEAVRIGLIDDPLHLLTERSRLQMLVDELTGQPEERVGEIASSYKDLLLSDNFIMLIRERLEAMADRDLDARRRDDESSLEESHEEERRILGQLVEYAQLLLKEARALGAELEATQLEIVRSICKVAMDPDYRTEEETANALTDAVRDMRPLLDDVFVAYLKYAVAEEEARLAREGVLDDPDQSEWLFVLKIVQQGVYSEIARSLNRYIEHVWYVLRMESKAERRMLLSKLIDDMPTMDIRPFVKVVENIVASLGDAVRGEFDGGHVLGEMTNKLLQLHRDMRELLPPERIELLSRDADEWAAKQKQRLLEQRNLTQQRLAASQDTEVYDDEIRRLGETERIE